MKKRLIALMAAVCLVIAPMSVPAEETDYSYLEDMSVKELKALRDAINEILGDDGRTSSTDTFDKHPEWAEIDITVPPYSDAIFISQTLKDSVSNEALFKLDRIDYNGVSSKDYYHFQFYVPNQVGGQQFDHCFIVMRDGEFEIVLDPTSDEGRRIDKNYFQGRLEDHVETLDVNFIESQLE